MSAPDGVITVMVVDDHPLLREGVAAVIEGQPDMRLVAEATDGHEALQYFRMHRPDVTLMDLRMPGMDGIAAITAIRSEFPDAHIAVLTTYPGDAQALRAFRAGASGYLLKSSLRRELVETVRALHAGKRRVLPEIAHEIAEHAAGDTLTAREIDVLKGVAAGNANKAVGVQLGISEETVKAHMKSILAKLGANDRTHAVVIALRRGFINMF
jgi:DNA-binding NarL/FixJ family response regulator